MGRDEVWKHTCIAYFAKSNNGSKEKDVIQSNQDVHVCGKIVEANLILLCSLKHISLFIETWKIFVRTWAIFILIFLLFFLSYHLSFLFLSSLSLSLFTFFPFFDDSLMPPFATKLFERDINNDLEHLF